MFKNYKKINQIKLNSLKMFTNNIKFFQTMNEQHFDFNVKHFQFWKELVSLNEILFLSKNVLVVNKSL